MPKRTDIKTILVIGSGPIIIGQACEFDYSGTQAIKALREEGYRVVLVNTNPATIMTDPDMADATYMEPLEPSILEQIIIKEKIDSIIPTIGGQTALNVAKKLDELGILKKHNIELIGANIESINKTEDRELFKNLIDKLGYKMPKSISAHTEAEALDAANHLNFPIIIRPSFTLGGTGASIAYNIDEYRKLITKGLDASPISEILLDESIIGWKEYELEVMTDKNRNTVIVCTIENFDPMGVHTGDSITVAPAQTLSDKEYQELRNAAICIMEEVGIETGGANVQFGVNPATGEFVVIEMNPRVSRSSALASKATGFPIARIAAKVAVGYTLDELRNDITLKTPASFEPSIDYVVTKIPRFNFEKFPGADNRLTTQMKSVGEAMGIGKTFKESMQKAINSMENGYMGFDTPSKFNPLKFTDNTELNKHIKENLATPRPDRLFYILEAFRHGLTPEDVFNSTKIDPWFIDNLYQIYELEAKLQLSDIYSINPELLTLGKKYGYSDAKLARILNCQEDEVTAKRIELEIKPVFNKIDTCAGEFEADTPYFYSTYNSTLNESIRKNNSKFKGKVIVLGSGPNRIGQGVEFDYACVKAIQTLRSLNYETIMINCNPETVSTDYNTSDVLYFEPLTFEHVMNIVNMEQPLGVIIQFGGQTPLKLAKSLSKAGVKILGTSPHSIDVAENRDMFQKFAVKLNLNQPENGTATTPAEASAVATKIGYPVMVRPSYVLGGRAMEIINVPERLQEYLIENPHMSADAPLLLDKYLQDAVEFDVDIVSDGENCTVGAIMHHIEEAGVHSGDSSCSIPTRNIPEHVENAIKEQAILITKHLKVIGLLNIQYALQGETLYILEVNPRASRTAPFVSKSIGKDIIKAATEIIMGHKIEETDLKKEHSITYHTIKMPVFPFNKFAEAKIELGPEMRSTGEVMGIDYDFGLAFYKASLAAGNPLPHSGNVLMTLSETGKNEEMLNIARQLIELNFKIYTTEGTWLYFKEHNVVSEKVNKINEARPNIVDDILNKKFQFIINLTSGPNSIHDAETIRMAVMKHKIPYVLTLQGAKACIASINSIQKHELTINPLQKYYS